MLELSKLYNSQAHRQTHVISKPPLGAKEMCWVEANNSNLAIGFDPRVCPKFSKVLIICPMGRLGFDCCSAQCGNNHEV